MKNIFCIYLFFSFQYLSAQQKIVLSSAKFSTGDNINYKEIQFDDAGWKSIQANTLWESQGYPDYDGYAWYRFHFNLPSSLKNSSFWKDFLRIYLAKIDDADETYLNGEKIGATGSFPESEKGYIGFYSTEREYRISTASNFLRWDKENVLAVRVYDGGGGGGIYGGTPFINMVDLIDGISINFHQEQSIKDAEIIDVENIIHKKITGMLSLKIIDGDADKVLNIFNQNIELFPYKSFHKKITILQGKRIIVIATFKEQNTGKIKTINYPIPYILTPKSSLLPQINGAKIYGVHSGSPFLFKIPATGQKPLHYQIKNLPPTLHLNESTGIITGSLPAAGEFKTEIVVTNDRGKTQREFKIKAGDLLALTPPLGWNSWYCWGLSVSQDKVKTSGQSLIDRGLADHGWNYVNIDDGWEAQKRADDSTILPNNKFPSMKELGEWLHSKGFKFGIYSSPGSRTCGGYLGSYKNELSDATTYSSWGVDYLKYDWCSYQDVFKLENDTSVGAYKKPYIVMQKALKSQPGDMIYSLCQYGMKDVWKWGSDVDGNVWRTTGDISDSWESIFNILSRQENLYSYAGPGHWNDPDMLQIGQLSFSNKPHITGLTPDEQYTQISLWCLLSAPLLIGCDVNKLDDFTLNLLSNDEVISVDQDVLGKQAKLIIKKNDYQIWMKEMEDGSKAIGILNLKNSYQTISVNWNELQLKENEKVRDLWRQKDLGSFANSFSTKVAPHGVRLLKVIQ